MRQELSFEEDAPSPAPRPAPKTTDTPKAGSFLSEHGFRHALQVAERLRSPRQAERLLVLALATGDTGLARAVLFQARSHGWDSVVARHLDRDHVLRELDE